MQQNLIFRANTDAEEAEKKHEVEKNKMNVLLKRAELKITSQQDTIAKLTDTVVKEQNENKELQALLDHLAGSGN